MNTNQPTGKITTREIAFGAVLAAVYVAITLINPLSFGEVQFRFSEILVLFCFYNRRFCIPMIIGCLIANFIASPFGWIDVILGTAGTALAVFPMSRIKNMWVSSLLPVVTNAVLVGVMLTYFVGVPLPLWQNMVFVGIGQFVVITAIGVPLFKVALERNKPFMGLIRAEKG
ncbi:MAG: QueT transporter family protein [Oscillospiraceae bacterium]|nr:QueT transporter family protein [Oscillospiraceae bacterium]